jgi:hypothetical protein
MKSATSRICKRMKLSLCYVIKHYAMKVYGRVCVWIHVFFTSALYGGEWSASRPGFLPLRNSTWYPFVGRPGGPRRRSRPLDWSKVQGRTFSIAVRNALPAEECLGYKRYSTIREVVDQARGKWIKVTCTFKNNKYCYFSMFFDVHWPVV